MTAQILDIEQFRATRASCLRCEHVWFMAEPEPEFDPEAEVQLLECPRCHHTMGAYADTWQLADADDGFE